MSEKFKNLTVRTISGVVLLIVVLASLLSGIYGFGLLLLAIIVGGVLELYNITKCKGYKPQRVLGVVCSIAIFALVFDYTFMDGRLALPLMLSIVMLVPTIFVVELYKFAENPLANLGSTFLGIVYVAAPVSLLCTNSMLLGHGTWNACLMISYIFIIWANDSFAYLFGVAFGSRPLMAKISPKKSWEGFFGGVCGAICIGLVVAYIFNESYLVWGGLALIIAVTGVLGDLVESMFKRSVNIKDSGSILPGHGGWLDRFDALILSAPFVFVYLHIMVMIGQL